MLQPGAGEGGAGDRHGDAGDAHFAGVADAVEVGIHVDVAERVGRRDSPGSCSSASCRLPAAPPRWRRGHQGAGHSAVGAVVEEPHRLRLGHRVGARQQSGELVEAARVGGRRGRDGQAGGGRAGQRHGDAAEPLLPPRQLEHAVVVGVEVGVAADGADTDGRLGEAEVLGEVAVGVGGRVGDAAGVGVSPCGWLPGARVIDAAEDDVAGRAGALVLVVGVVVGGGLEGAGEGAAAGAGAAAGDEAGQRAAGGEVARRDDDLVLARAEVAEQVAALAVGRGGQQLAGGQVEELDGGAGRRPARRTA